MHDSSKAVNGDLLGEELVPLWGLNNFPASLKDKTKAQAAIERKTMPEVVADALRMYFAHYEKRGVCTCERP